MNGLYEIIKRPIISEKSTLQSETLHSYAFEVAVAANRQQIHESIEKLFKVKVESVRTMIIHGKYKRAGRGIKKRANWKKAVVTVKEGQKIEFFQGA
ncbi:MAG: 50S ribosomal protein L23 [Deltaproteobacteria bacterium]|nr:50S ribosomal protein L23 [Deltaproteobacteria bacterium]